MKRKIIKQGPNTLMVSLPRAWVKKYSVKKGDLMEVTEKGRTLILSEDKEVMLDSYKIRIKDCSQFLKRFVRTPYMIGYEAIELEYDDPKVEGLIQKELPLLLGYEAM